MSKVMANGETEAASRLNFTANIYQGDGWYVAECPELGTASQGRTVEAAISNLKEATELYLEEFPETLKQPLRPASTLEQDVRDLEQAYTRQTGEQVAPADMQPIQSVTFSIETAYA